MAAPHVDESLIEELVLYLQVPRSVKELLAHLDISRASLYRYFQRLRHRGYRVERRHVSKPAKYVIGVI